MGKGLAPSYFDSKNPSPGPGAYGAKDFTNGIDNKN